MDFIGSTIGVLPMLLLGAVALAIVYNLSAPMRQRHRLKRLVRSGLPSEPKAAVANGYEVGHHKVEVEAIGNYDVALRVRLPAEPLGWDRMAWSGAPKPPFSCTATHLIWDGVVRNGADMKEGYHTLLAARDELVAVPRLTLLVERWRRSREYAVLVDLIQDHPEEAEVAEICSELVNTPDAAPPMAAIYVAERSMPAQLLELTSLETLSDRALLAVFAWVGERSADFEQHLQVAVGRQDGDVLTWVLNAAHEHGFDVTDAVNRRVAGGSVEATRATHSFWNAGTQPALFACLNTDVGIARYIAAERLGEVVDADRIGSLTEAMNAASDDSDLRSALAGAIGRVRQRFGLPDADGGLTLATEGAGLSLAEAAPSIEVDR